MKKRLVRALIVCGGVLLVALPCAIAQERERDTGEMSLGRIVSYVLVIAILTVPMFGIVNLVERLVSRACDRRRLRTVRQGDALGDKHGDNVSQ